MRRLNETTDTMTMSPKFLQEIVINNCAAISI